MSQHAQPEKILNTLASRLKHVKMLCGDWRRAVTKTEIGTGQANDSVAVMLDPPYGHDVRNTSLYARESSTIAKDVKAWAIDHASPELKIALCCMAGEHIMPEGWNWAPTSGTKGQGNSYNGGEGIWFSPHCIDPNKRQRSLFDTLNP